jgi:hypothetical protein
LRRQAGLEALRQAFDRLRLVTGGLVRGDKLETVSHRLHMWA